MHRALLLCHKNADGKARGACSCALLLKELQVVACLSVISSDEVREQEKGCRQIRAQWRGKPMWQLLAKNKDGWSLAIGFLVALRGFTPLRVWPQKPSVAAELRAG